jgi:aconitase A
LRDIWPTRDEVSKVSNEVVVPELFKKNYASILKGNEAW